MIVIGLMSGTSADGVDAAVIRLDGAPPTLDWRLLAHVHRPHPPELRREILACCRPETGDVARLCRLGFTLGRAFAEAALLAVEAARLTPTQVDLIGSHGQTVWHDPVACTLQIGEAAIIAEATGVTTVSNFRARDVAAGGHGAPLVAYVDRLLFTDAIRPRACQNIGGIANVTYLPPAAGRVGEVAFAFDTGPGNMLMDDAATRATDGAWTYDVDGALAAGGRVDEALLAEWLAQPYFRRLPPKTTGRELFGAQMGAAVWEQGVRRGLRGEDIVATLTALTARSIAAAYRDFLPSIPNEVIVSGGGARNPTLLAMLTAALADVRPDRRPPRVVTSDAFGLPADAKEAIAFAVLAYETWHGRPGNDPASTGAHTPVVLGDVTPGRLWRRGAAAGGADAGALPVTEARNPATAQIDALDTLGMVRLMNAEDQRVADAVAEQAPAIARAIDLVTEQMRAGGRLIYVGAGTSGRLGALDAAEAPPTFGVSPGLVVALQAGGQQALTVAVEGAEDDAGAGAHDLAALGVDARDSVVGIAASGRTPYVLGALAQARQRGARVIGLTCALPSPFEALADVMIAPIVGPEVITGSTRLKAGTAQKMVLNMLSTGVMIRLGKTFGNLMVDVQPTNTKLRARARRIVEQACASAGKPISADEAAAALAASGGEVKTAIVALLLEVEAEHARRRLAEAGGSVRAALG